MRYVEITQVILDLERGSRCVTRRTIGILTCLCTTDCGIPHAFAGAVPQRRGEPLLVDADEEPPRGKIDKMAGLRAAFSKTGTVTAANASSINDGAAALVVCSAKVAKSRGFKVLARILDDSSAAVEPKWFTIAPVDALAKLFQKTDSKASDWDLYEINEAFSGVTMAAAKEHGIPLEKVNPK